MPLSPEQITTLFGHDAALWAHLTDSTRQEITDAYTALHDDREGGLVNMPNTNFPAENDCLAANQLRSTFRTELVEGLLAPIAPHTTTDGSAFHTTTGYVVGIGMMKKMLKSFSNSEAVQICFGLDKPLANCGQLQLVFRGIGGPTPPKFIYTTGTPGAGTDPDTPRVKICNATTNPGCS